MNLWVGVAEASVGGPTTLVGRPSSTRDEWETARAADAADLNRLLETGGEVEAYVAPFWSNFEVERCLQELRGFDDAEVFAAPIPGEGFDEALATIAESEWAGAAYLGADKAVAATVIHAAASLDFPVFLPCFDRANDTLVSAIDDDLTLQEIEKRL